MLAVAVDVEASALKNPKTAALLLSEIGRAVPPRRRNRNAVIPQPAEIESDPLSHARLEAIRQKEGEIEFATLGSGNHFLEMQADEEDRLWLMVHSGSRALGQVIRDHHLARAQPAEGRLRALDAESDTGKAYLHDALWARQFAAASRKAMAEETDKVLMRALKCSISWETMIAIDHIMSRLSVMVSASCGCIARAQCPLNRDSSESYQDRWVVPASMWRDAGAKRRFVRALTARAEP